MVGPGGFPDFVIVGAPRAGTTFMFEYLGAHPDVYVPARKEPHHFATDLDSGSVLDSLTFVRSQSEYLALFAPAASDQKTGEASTWYLYSEAAARGIHAANPATRIIAMLRDPVQMLYSLHGRRYYAGSEDIADFGEALAAEADRRQGRRIPPKARNIKGLFYRAVGSYADQVQRYFDAFGRDGVHVVVFDDFIADPGKSYAGVLDFIGLDTEFSPEMRVVNASATRRSQRLQGLLLRPSVIRSARLIVPVRARPALGRAWDRVSSRTQARPPLDPNVAATLRAELMPDIERLSRMLDRDLVSLWS